MGNGENQTERLGSLIKETTIKLHKLEARKLNEEGEFDAKNIRGKYVVDEVKKIDGTHLEAFISFHLFYEKEEKFLEINIECSVNCILLKELTRQVPTKEDNKDLFVASLPLVDEVLSPVIKAMGYELKLV